MSLQEIVQQVSYVTNLGGQPTAVQVQIDLWEQIIELLQQALPTTAMAEEMTAEQDEAWDLFLTLAADAQPGTLENSSVEHDRYLYGPSV